MGDLTKNFSRVEFACRCNCGFDTVDYMLVTELQKIRDLFNLPIVIVGPNRCPKHNAEVNGAKDSQHMKGKAVDMRIVGVSIPQLHEFLLREYPGKYGIGVYETWVHFDVRDTEARWSG